MKHVIKRQALVPYSPKQMYALVDRIEDYPLFLPYCVESRVLSRSQQEVLGSLKLSIKGMRQSFTTRNLIDPPHSIRLTLMDGPFQSLEGVWKFNALPEEAGCQVSLHLEFELSNEWFSQLFGMFFKQVANKLVEAFCHRADEVYS